MIAYKLLRRKKDGTITPLFIDKTRPLPVGKWLIAEDHPTKGYAHRPGWHATTKPEAPHLSMDGREWWKVEITDFYEFHRSEHQGGTWFIAQRIKLLERIEI